MLRRLYGKWMYAWETALTTRDSNRVERPLEWGFEHLADFGGAEAAALVARGECSALEAMTALNERIVASVQAKAAGADIRSFFDYDTPADFRIEMQFPELYPTNVRPETLEQEREWRRQAEAGELRKVPFLRFTSPLRTPYPENDVVNARWYPAPESGGADKKQVLRDAQDDEAHRRPRQAMIVMPQWNADAFSHNALCEIFNRFGISCLRMSKPYHDVRRPAELERSDYAVSSNVGRTIAACRQAVMDVRSCVDWLASQGYEQFGVLGTSLGSAYAFISAAMDSRIRVCAFNHASTQFGDVVWTGQSTRHVKSAFEHAGLTQDEVRGIFAGVSPASYMEQYAATGRPRWEGESAERSAELPRRSSDVSRRSPDLPRRSLVVYAPYDLTFIERYSLEVLRSFDALGIDYVAKVLPCGHYTTGETPYKYIDGWYLGKFVWESFKRLRGE
jgi:hypothetical protein